METEAQRRCRLCAMSRPISKMLDLQDDSKRSHETMYKLSKLNLTCLNLFNEETLPKTVCIICLTNLDNAASFVDNIAKAQVILRDICMNTMNESAVNIKKELIESSHNIASASTEEIGSGNIKAESNIVNVNVDIEMCRSDSDSPEPPKIVKRKAKAKPKSSSGPISPWVDFTWLCAECDLQYNNIRELVAHSMEQHSKCTTFKCPQSDCKVRKLSHDGFIMHMKRHDSILKKSCHFCYEVFATQNVVKNHYKMHLIYDNVCRGCYTSFPTATELNLHLKKYYTDRRAIRVRKDPDQEEETTCKICNKTLTSYTCLLRHLKLHEERKKDHTCEKCGKCFYSKHTLASHLAGHLNIRPHQCKICTMSFQKRSHLRAHISTHEGIRPFSCDQCHKRFRLQKTLTSHMIVHSDTFPFICTYCDKGFKFKALLNNHILQHTGVKPYSCNICQRDFTNWPNYNKHMKRRHGMNMAKKKRTPYGEFPINPMTGEVQILPLTSNTEEWKKSIMMKQPTRKPKPTVTVENDPTSNVKLEITNL